MTPYHERLTVRLREAAEEYRHGQHTGASDQRLVLLMNAAKALEDVSGNLAQARAERDAAEAKIAGANMVARQMMDRLDGTQAALTEARRVLWEVDKRVIQCSLCYAIVGGYRPEPHTPDCALAAVLAQEEK